MLKFVSLVLLLCISLGANSQVRSVRVILPKERSAMMDTTKAILIKQLKNRSGVKIVNDTTAELTIELGRGGTGGAESFSIQDKGKRHIQITGADDPGILYGTGKFLRTSRFDQNSFTPGTWRGSSAPSGKVRGIYLATHFNNFYEAAPIGEVQNYVEELALWGVNYIVIHFAHWQYTSYYDADAQQALTRFREIMGIARACGMKVGLLQVPNQGFKYTRNEFLNTPVPDELGRRGHFGVNLDPSNEGANKLLKENWHYLLEQFKDMGLDVVAFFPYDEGGCGCDKCWPWGAKGYPKICRELTEMAKAQFPAAKIVLGTWMYDTPEAGEWEGLTNLLKKDNSWLDYIMADAHEDFPRYPLDKGVPGNLPLVNFPEISMWGQHPWGGFGTNPLVHRLQRLWDQTSNKLSGGFPYSEGIYDDMNKVICAQLYWGKEKVSTTGIIKEYVAYEYGQDVVDEVTKAIEILESNHVRKQIKASAIEAFKLIVQAEKKITPQVAKSWRWRILYLRALIDQEMYKRGGKLEGEVLKAAFNELTEIYHAENAHSRPIHPPVIK